MPDLAADDAVEFFAIGEESGKVNLGLSNKTGGHPVILGNLFKLGRKEIIPSQIA